MNLATISTSIILFCSFRSAKPSPIDTPSDSTVVLIPYSSGPQHRHEEVGIQEVRVVSSASTSCRNGQVTMKNTSSLGPSKPSSHKKERRKLEREKKKGKQGSEGPADRVPILRQDNSSEDEEEVVTIYPEASPQRRSQDDRKWQQEELLPCLKEEGHNGEEEDSTSSERSLRESSDTKRSLKLSSTAPAGRSSSNDRLESLEIQWQDSQT